MKNIVCCMLDMPSSSMAIYYSLICVRNAHARSGVFMSIGHLHDRDIIFEFNILINLLFFQFRFAT